ncbi:MAG: hypothetical protein AAB442_02360 [Patescibacteria group bacterium]
MHTKKIMVTVSALALFLAAAPAFAETRATSTLAARPTDAAKIACVGAAVNIREAALVNAMVTFGSATNAAYTTRAATLKQAYTATSSKELRTAVKAAWTTFSTSEKAARKAWKMARDTAWKEYRTAAVACKAPDGTGDGVNSVSERRGD